MFLLCFDFCRSSIAPPPFGMRADTFCQAPLTTPPPVLLLRAAPTLSETLLDCGVEKTQQ